MNNTATTYHILDLTDTELTMLLWGLTILRDGETLNSIGVQHAENLRKRLGDLYMGH